MKKLLMVMVLGASAVAASAQGLQRRSLGSRLARPRPQISESIVGKEAIKVIPTAREGGTAWKYRESAKPLANWGDLSFDDKDWKEGVSGFGNSYGLRRTVWGGGANDLYLRKTFSISSTTGQIERVTLTYAIDDDIEVLLNGAELFSRKVGGWAKYASVDVTKNFKRLVLEPGKENVIAVKAHDRMPPCYADVGLEIVLSDSIQGQKNVLAQPAESRSAAHVADVVLIPFGETEWKYKMQGEVEENWKSPDFNDASWANGKTPFGNGTWTTSCICLRKKFDCHYEDADIKYLQIREGIDDVLDIWLNGSHIFHWTYHGNSDLTTVVPRKLWEGLLRRKGNVLTVLARDWGGGRFVNVGLTAMVRQSVGRELVCPTEYVPADMKLLFPATKLADIQVCSAVLTGDAVNWGRPTAVLASNVKSVGDVRKTMQFQRLENNGLKCACVELEQKGRGVWGRVLYCRSVEHCDVSGVDFDTLLCPTHRIIDNDSEISNGQGAGYGLKEFTAYFASADDLKGTCSGTSTGLKRPGLLGGSLRARRLQRQQEAGTEETKLQTEQADRDAERQAQAAQEKAQREAERAEQRQQLLAIQEELKRVKEAKAAAAKSECAATCAANESTAATSRAANSCTNDSSKADGPVTLTGPYGLRIDADPGCGKGAEYVLKRLKDDILPCTLRYYGDPFAGQKPTRVFTLHVKRNDGTGRSKYTGVSWGSCGDGIDSFTIGLAKGNDKWEMDLPLVASKILTVCSESDSAAFSIYANDFVRGEIGHYDPVPKIKEDIRKGLGQGEAENEREKRRLGVLRKLAPTWAAFEELREKHPTLVLDYCNFKNSKYAKGELPQKISADQMVALMGEVTGVDAVAIFKKHSAASVSSTPQGKIAVGEKLGQCDFLLNKDFKKNAKFYLCLFSASWCSPCRAEMPRIAKIYAETLKDDPDIELIHFSRDQNDEKALAWAKEHDVKFPVVKPNGGNPLDLHSRGIPHLFIVKADGTLVEEGHPMKIFNEEKFREIKDGRMEPRVANVTAKENELTAEVDGYTWTYTMKNGTAVIGAITDGRCRMSERRCAISPNPTGHITIPSILNGVKVVGIGENALCGCKGIKSITIPEGVTCIGRCAFNRCEGLTGVKIPDSVTTIGEYSFDWCGSITNVTLGEGVTTIGSCAFRGCYGLTGIRIPKSVKKIENSAFIFSDKMKEFVVDEENENYTTMNGMILSRDGRKLHEGVNGDVLIPDSVTSVLAMAFCRRSGLKSVRLPNSVTNIDGFSFASCCALKSLRIPASVTSIGANAFGGCKELSSVTMCGERPELGEKAFDRCDSLKSIHVPATAKSWAGMKEWQGIPLVFDADGTASEVGDSTTA